jgi:hypothetical protein
VGRKRARCRVLAPAAALRPVDPSALMQGRGGSL